MLVTIPSVRKRVSVLSGAISSPPPSNDALTSLSKRHPPASNLSKGNVAVVNSTANHPFYVEGRGWVNAEHLQPGDRLRTDTGRWAKVKSIADTGRTEPVYNMCVDTNCTYFVHLPSIGINVLVHNISQADGIRDANDEVARQGKQDEIWVAPSHDGKHGLFHVYTKGGWYTPPQYLGTYQFDATDDNDMMEKLHAALGGTQLGRIHSAANTVKEIVDKGTQVAGIFIPGPEEAVVGAIVGKALEKLAPLGIKAVYKAGKWVFQSPEGKELEGEAAVAAGKAFAKAFEDEGRAAYEAEVRSLSDVGKAALESGQSEEAVARQLSQMRRDIGVKYKGLTSPDKLAEITARNIEKYGDPLGPTVDWLRARGYSWADIIKSAAKPGGKDLGF